MDRDDTASAHRLWDERWATEAGRAGWLTPEPEVIAIAAGLRRPARALDLGCGVGRHALYLAERGFTTVGVDASTSGIDFCRREGLERRLPLVFVVSAMTELPCAGRSFDYVLAWNVIHHGDGQVVRRSIAEIHRVLRPGAIYHGTMLTKRHHAFGVGREIAPGTFVDDTAVGEDKRHPHFYCDRDELGTLFTGFELRSVVEREQKPGKHHWHVVAVRRG